MDLIIITPIIFTTILGIVGWFARNHIGRIKALEMAQTNQILINKANNIRASTQLESIKNIEAEAQALTFRFNEHTVTVASNAATVATSLEGIKEQLTYQLQHIDSKLDRVIEREIMGREKD